MKNIKTAVIFLLCIAVIAVSFAACAGNGDKQNTTTTLNTAVAGEVTQTTEVEKVIKVEVEENPNMKVSVAYAEKFSFGGSSVTITGVRLTDMGAGNVYGFLDFTLDSLDKKPENLVIPYKTFDADGNLITERTMRLRLTENDSLADGTGVCRFAISRDTASVEIG